MKCLNHPSILLFLFPINMLVYRFPFLSIICVCLEGGQGGAGGVRRLKVFGRWSALAGGEVLPPLDGDGIEQKILKE